MNQALVALAIQEAPAAIGLLRDLFTQHHPDEPVPTDDQLAAAWRNAYQSSLAKDQTWLSVHPGV